MPVGRPPPLGPEVRVPPLEGVRTPTGFVPSVSETPRPARQGPTEVSGHVKTFNPSPKKNGGPVFNSFCVVLPPDPRCQYPPLEPEPPAEVGLRLTPRTGLLKGKGRLSAVSDPDPEKTSSQERGRKGDPTLDVFLLFGVPSLIGLVTPQFTVPPLCSDGPVRPYRRYSSLLSTCQEFESPPSSLGSSSLPDSDDLPWLMSF